MANSLALFHRSNTVELAKRGLKGAGKARHGVYPDGLGRVLSELAAQRGY